MKEGERGRERGGGGGGGRREGGALFKIFPHLVPSHKSLPH